MRRAGPLAWAFVLVVLAAGPAAAHAERVRSTPDEGDLLRKAPAKVSVDFSEPPISNPGFEVIDGCGDDVAQSVDVNGMTIDAALGAGEPGVWRVRFRVVSGADGHPTRDAFTFQVKGAKRCGGGGGGAGDEDGSAAGPGSNRGGDASSFPVGWLVAGVGATVVLVLVALVARRGDD